MSLNLVDWLGDHAWAWFGTMTVLFTCVRILTRGRWPLVLAGASVVAAVAGAVAMLGDRGVQIAVPVVVFVVAAAVLTPILRPWTRPGESPIDVPDDSGPDAPRHAAARHAAGRAAPRHAASDPAAPRRAR